MAKNQIAGIQFKSIRGGVSLPYQKVLIRSVPGVQGHVLKRLGKKADIYFLFCVSHHSSGAQAQIDYAVMNLLAGGNLISWIDAHGVVFSSVAVVNLFHRGVTAYLASTDGAGARLETTWAMLNPN